MRPVTGQELVPELLFQRHIAGEHVGRQQSFEEVVVPAVAVTPREAELARDGIRLEHGAHGVRRHPEPVGRRPALALEIERRQRAVRADSLEHAVGHLGVLVQDPRRGPAEGPAEPGKLARRHEGESLVVRLEDLAAFVEELAPARLVVGDPRMQHEVVASPGDREGIELDRAELAEHVAHGIEAPLERSRRREEVPGDEKAPRSFSGDLHWIGRERGARATVSGLSVAHAAGEARIRRMDVQHPQFSVSDVAETVRDTDRRGDVRARPGANDLVADHELGVTVDDVERVDMIRMAVGGHAFEVRTESQVDHFQFGKFRQDAVVTRAALESLPVAGLNDDSIVHGHGQSVTRPTRRRLAVLRSLRMQPGRSHRA